MVFAPGSEPLAKLRTLHKGDTMHVVGIPRISLALVAWRLENRNNRPEALQWSLPYEIVVVADFDDIEGPGPAIPAPASESDVIMTLGRLLSAETSDELQKGACPSLGNLTFAPT
jgi:hypothetical protein